MAKKKRGKFWFIRMILFALVACVGGIIGIYRQSIKVEPGDQVKVIDVSSWNGKVHWSKVKKEGIFYAMLRIGRGNTGTEEMAEDAWFLRNYESGKFYNMRMGLYFYSYATTEKEAKSEAEYCLQLLKNHKIDPEDLELPIAYDVEEKSTFATGRKNVSNLTAVFCDTIKEAGYTPMVYSSAGHLLKYFKHSTIKDYQIWVAHYGVEKSGPSYPYAYDMWQYTCEGIVPGANTSGEDDKGNCDINYYTIHNSQNGSKR